MKRDRKLHWRRTVLFGVPVLYVVLGLLHPTANPEVGDDTALWIWLHLAQFVLIGGLAYVLRSLVDGLDNRAAALARALIIPFVIVYTTLDAILGLAWGIVAQKANQLATADQPAAQQLVHDLLEPSPAGYVLYFGAGLLWLCVVIAMVFALAPSAPKGALRLIAFGGVLFGVGHAPPTGPLGMAMFLAGVVWLELRPRPPLVVSVDEARTSPVAPAYDIGRAVG